MRVLEVDVASSREILVATLAAVGCDCKGAIRKVHLNREDDAELEDERSEEGGLRDHLNSSASRR